MIKFALKRLKFAKIGCLCLVAMAPVILSGAKKSDAPINAMSQSEIHKTISGNTLISLDGNSVDFNEFHSPNGQVFGSNDNVANDKFCWRVVANQVCYTIPGENLCYWLVKDGRTFTMQLEAGLMHRIAIAPGDPLKLNGKPRSWACPNPTQQIAAKPVAPLTTRLGAPSAK